MSKSEDFKAAWAVAKYSSNMFGGSSKEYFAESLKLVYKTKKENAMYFPGFSRGEVAHGHALICDTFRFNNYGAKSSFKVGVKHIQNQINRLQSEGLNPVGMLEFLDKVDFDEKDSIPVPTPLTMLFRIERA